MYRFKLQFLDITEPFCDEMTMAEVSGLLITHQYGSLVVSTCKSSEISQDMIAIQLAENFIIEPLDILRIVVISLPLVEEPLLWGKDLICQSVPWENKLPADCNLGEVRMFPPDASRQAEI